MTSAGHLAPSQMAKYSKQHMRARTLTQVQVQPKEIRPFVATREQCRKALKTAILIDKMQNNQCADIQSTAIGKMTDLILFGCQQTLQDLNCLTVDYQNEPKLNESDLRAYGQCIDQNHAKIA